MYAPRHIGHLSGVYLPADVYARYCRLRGREVLFVCGTDENAATTIIEARRRSVSPQALSDEGYAFQREVFDRLGMSFDIYSRTSREVHHRTVWEFYGKLEREGLIYRSEVVQPYCEKCGQPLPDRFVKGGCPRCGAENQYGESCEACAHWFDASELLNPRCTLCGTTPTMRKVEHAFLRLSSLEEKILEYVEGPGRCWRRRTLNRTLSWLREVGLIDKDITRDYDWGPGAPFLEEGQVIYNWSENLIGYISATRDWAGHDEKRWRPYWEGGSRIVNFLGKDNLFFHTVLFPALLIGNGDYALPSQVVVNEFVNMPEGKMSTSRENAVWLHDLLERLKPEVIRYYAAAIAPENRDTVFSWEDLVNRVNADLADNIGNLVNRVLVLAGKIPGEVGGEIQLDEEHSSFLGRAQDTIDSVIESIDGLEVKRGLEAILEQAREGNRFLNEKRPWEKGPGGRETVWVLLKLLGILSVLLSSYLPETAEVIWSSLGHEGKISQRGWDECLGEDPREPRVKRLILFEKLALEDVAPGER